MGYAFDSDFSEQLQRKLEVLVFTQQLRCRLYGANVAEESPISHTPPEVKEQYRVGRAATTEDWDAPTPDEEEVWDRPASKFTSGHGLLDTPPSDNSSQTSWGSVLDQAKPVAPTIIARSLHTPAQSMDEKPSTVSPKTAAAIHLDVTRDHSRAGMKRSFAQITGDRLDEPRSCRNNRIIISPRRLAMSVG